jgi:hypothetical protein
MSQGTPWSPVGTPPDESAGGAVPVSVAGTSSVLEQPGNITSAIIDSSMTIRDFLDNSNMLISFSFSLIMLNNLYYVYLSRALDLSIRNHLPRTLRCSHKQATPAPAATTFRILFNITLTLTYITYVTVFHVLLQPFRAKPP